MFSIVIFGGRKLFGRIDRVPGLLHVATMFVHIFFIPLIPLKSYIVLDSTVSGGNFRGIEFGLNPKSMLVAYFRAFFILAALYQVFWLVRLFMYVGPLRIFPIFTILKLIVYIGLFVALGKIFRAGRERALELAAKAGIDKATIEQRFANAPAERI
jgi:hypothetical protein